MHSLHAYVECTTVTTANKNHCINMNLHALTRMDMIEDGSPNTREIGFKIAMIAVVITTNMRKSCGPG